MEGVDAAEEGHCRYACLDVAAFMQEVSRLRAHRLASVSLNSTTPRSRSPPGYDRASAHSRYPGEAHQCCRYTKIRGLVGESPTLPGQPGAYSAQGSLPCVREPEQSGELGDERVQ
jgi:hypothetical protein